MKTIELWIWTHTDPSANGKRVKTRYRLSEADAIEQLVDPVRVEHTREVRNVPGGPHEWHMTGGFRNSPRNEATSQNEKNRPPSEG